MESVPGFDFRSCPGSGAHLVDEHGRLSDEGGPSNARPSSTHDIVARALTAEYQAGHQIFLDLEGSTRF